MRLPRHPVAPAAALAAVVGASAIGVGVHQHPVPRSLRPRSPARVPAPAPGHPRPGPEPSAACGIERWDVKTGTDPAATAVDQAGVQVTTIAALDALAAPVSPTGRVAPVEVTTYEVTAKLNVYKIETDSDYHLALDDGAGHTMIAEIPDPNCISTGPFKTPVSEARRVFDTQLHATPNYQPGKGSVTITGVGFFDRIHGQRGVAPNGIELHPVLAISFGP